MSVDDEIDAISRSQRGDGHAFNWLVECYQDRVYTLCYRLLGDSDVADDACQEVFISAFRAIRRYHGGSFIAWLLRIARNECYDQLRRRGRQISLDAAQDVIESAPRLLLDPSEALEERVLRAELALTLERILLALPPDQRLVVVLRDVQGYSYAEIVSATGWPEGTVRSRLSRARSRLRTAVNLTTSDTQAMRAHTSAFITKLDSPA